MAEFPIYVDENREFIVFDYPCPSSDAWRPSALGHTSDFGVNRSQIQNKVFLYFVFHHSYFLQWRIPGSEIEKLFHAESQEQQKRILENFARDLPVTNRTIHGSVRFCEKCQIIKPDRGHHCSVCGMCVLKMDHHCPW